MRRMRDVPVFFYVLTVSIIGAVIGVQYLNRHQGPEKSTHADASAVIHPSAFRGDSANGKRHLASGGGDKFAAIEDHGNERGNKHSEDADEAENTATDEDVKHLHARAPLPADADAHASKSREPASALAETAAHAEASQVANATGDGVCNSVEYPGGNPAMLKVEATDWTQVMSTFHGVKEDLMAWLKKHRTEFPEATFTAMTQQIEELKIQRPPFNNEPDLAWRGVGVWSHDGDESLIKVGSGLVKQIMKDPIRGKFELARLVAQSWAPCELARVHGGEAWGPLLSCMGVNEVNACGENSWSEGGWAVSSVIANAVANPGCTLPAFKDEKMSACLKKIPLPLTLVLNTRKSGWKEARR